MEIKGIILIIGILIIGILADFDITQRSHTDYYDITLIYKTYPEYNGNGCKPNIFIRSSLRLGCYDVEIYLKTNAVGMPLEYNGLILSSNNKSLEFIADEKYPNGIFTNNIVQYDPNNWAISTLSMLDPNRFSTHYNLLLWKANTYNTDEFKIEWKQKKTIETCISLSYILRESSKCSISMEIKNLNNKLIRVVNSNNLQQTKELKTVLFKSSDLLLEGLTYSLNLNVKNIDNYYGNQYYDFEMGIHIQTDRCMLGIKRIAQCTDEYQNEELYKMSTQEYKITSNAEQALGVYPYGKQKLFSNKFSSSMCLNGGFLYNNTCICPPGFKGNACEYACGPNTFGVDCSGVCSMYRTGCQNMKFCTKGFGCICPSGFTGINCEKKCTKGTYGVDCAQRCPEKCNLEICDIYTGSCTEGCKQNYILPDCIEKYPWLNQLPKLKSLDFYSITLKLNFDSENINGSKTIIPTYYQIIYKPANETEYQYTEHKEINQHKVVTETVDNLKPETTYSFGVIIMSGDGNYNFEDIVTVNYTTLCRWIEDIDYGVHLLSGIDYINVTWNTLHNQNEDECKIIGYMLKLMYYGTDIEQKRYLEEIKFNNHNNNNNNNNNNRYTFDNLLSGRKYAVQIRAISATRQATESEISSISTRPYGFVKIQNIKAEFFNNHSAMKITWNTDDIPKTYIVKYKINRNLSCSHEVVKSYWTPLLVYNQTKCEIYDIIPNTQYIIQIVPTIEGYNYTDYENILFVKTPTSTPALKPVYVENSSYVTNQTAYFNWTIDKNECSKLNGFFIGYRVVLKNILKGTRTEHTTKKGTINYDELDTILDPDTKYELLVYVRTNYGYNTEQALSIPFQTKSKFLAPVEELTVYKKNLKRKSIGIRWSFPDERSVNGFVISANNDEIGFTKQITVESEKCTAWPTYYCATFENLIPNNQYTIKMKAKSSEYPLGGSAASVIINFNDGFSDKPENLKATYVSSRYITLEWGIPWIFNGVLKSFIINTEEISSKIIDKCCESKPDEEVQVTEEMPTYNYTIYNLKPGSTYSIGVLSKTSSYGQTNRIHVTTMSDIDDTNSLNNSTTESNVTSI